MRLKITGTGLDAILEDLDRAIHETPRELKRQLDRAVDRTTEQMREVAPVKTGRLKASGTWSSSAEAGIYEATIEFGGELAPYAMYALHSGSNGTRMNTVFAMSENAVDDAISEAFPF
jgi:hypothetical protein